MPVVRAQSWETQKPRQLVGLLCLHCAPHQIPLSLSALSLTQALGAQRRILKRPMTLLSSPCFSFISLTGSTQQYTGQNRFPLPPCFSQRETKAICTPYFLPCCAAGPLTATHTCLHRCIFTLLVKVRKQISQSADLWDVSRKITKLN